MRIRTIKPEFFLHDGLYDLEAETGLPVRVAFIGLWCAADREGRFQWSERRLKALILPYDDVDFSRVLHALVTRGFLVKYASNGEWFGAIPSFKKHQIINNKEKASDLPEVTNTEQLDASTTRDSREGHACHKEGKGKEGKGTCIAPTPSTPASNADFPPKPDGLIEPEMRHEPKQVKRDEVYEALGDIDGGWQKLTESAKGRVRRALKEIRDSDPTVTVSRLDVERRAAEFRRVMPWKTLTALSLAGEWARLGMNTQAQQMNLVSHSDEPLVLPGGSPLIKAVRANLAKPASERPAV